jgi:hypothetical protein
MVEVQDLLINRQQLFPEPPIALRSNPFVEYVAP